MLHVDCWIATFSSVCDWGFHTTYSCGTAASKLLRAHLFFHSHCMFLMIINTQILKGLNQRKLDLFFLLLEDFSVHPKSFVSSRSLVVFDSSLWELPWPGRLGIYASINTRFYFFVIHIWCYLKTEIKVAQMKYETSNTLITSTKTSWENNSLH